jgi:hypothetical protein
LRRSTKSWPRKQGKDCRDRKDRSYPTHANTPS